MELMKIGELAKRSGCSVQTIRYYEREGLLSSAARSEGNFRLYDKYAEERLMFVKRCRSLDLTLVEVKQLLTLTQEPGSACDKVNQILDLHIQRVEDRIAELQDLHSQLIGLRGHCAENRTVEQCGIIRGLKAEGG
ncbi:Cd(II)/Pb(II)-responsive transcriptional regulator [Aurantivibrio plasticivorans]